MAEAKKTTRPTEVRTPEFRVSYPSVFKPKYNDLSDKEEYIVDALFDKDKTDMKPFEKAIEAALEAKFGKARPKKWRNPIKDGDETDNPDYENHWLITFKSSVDYPPVVVGSKRGADGKLETITSREFYGGCFARAVVNAYAYDNQANKGVAFGLGNIQKLRDGEKFGGGGSFDPDDDFADTPESDDDGDDLDF